MNVSHIVERYVRDVEDRLRGPRVARRALADEIRDHILDAVEATAGGTDSVDSAESVIAGFGQSTDVARHLQHGLSRHNDRRTAIALLGAAAGISLLWFWIFVSGPRAPWTEPQEPRMLVWSDIVGSTAMKMTIAAAVVSVLCSWILPRALRSVHHAERTARLAGRLCLAGIMTLTLGVAIILGYAAARGLLAPGSLEWSDIALGALISLGALSGLGRLGSSLSPLLGAGA